MKKIYTILFIFMMMSLCCLKVNAADGTFDCTYTWGVPYLVYPGDTDPDKITSFCSVQFTLDSSGNFNIINNKCPAVAPTGIGRVNIKVDGISKETFLNKDATGYECKTLYGGALSVFEGAFAGLTNKAGKMTFPSILGTTTEVTVKAIQGKGSGTKIPGAVSGFSKSCHYNISDNSKTNNYSVTVAVTVNGSNYSISATSQNNYKVQMDEASKNKIKQSLKKESDTCPDLGGCCYPSSIGVVDCVIGNSDKCTAETMPPSGEGVGEDYSGDAMGTLTEWDADPEPIKSGYETCKELLGNSLSSLVKTIRILFQVAGVAICLINGMMSFTAAIATKDPQALSKAGRKLAIMLCILAVIVLLPTIIRVLARLIGGYDLSCI